MKNGEFLHMLNGIDEKYIDSAGRELENYRNQQKKDEKNHRKFAWKNMAAAAACTAVVFAGVFAVLINTGKIRFGSDGAGVSLDAASNGLYFPISDEYQLGLNEETSGTISVNAAYGYEDNFEKIKCYEIGDKFGENAEITDAKSTFLIINGNAILTEQEITLADERIFPVRLLNQYDSMTALGYPEFGEDFDFSIDYLNRIDISGLPENADIFTKENSVQISVNYSKKTVCVTLENDEKIRRGELQ